MCRKPLARHALHAMLDNGMAPPSYARPLTRALLPFAVAFLPLALLDEGSLVTKAGRASLAVAMGCAVAAIAVAHFLRQRTFSPALALALSGASPVAAPLPLHWTLPRALGRDGPLPFGANAEVFSELYAASALGSVLAVSAGVALLRAGRPPTALLGLLVFALARAGETGACSILLGAPHDGTATALAYAGHLGWTGVLGCLPFIVLALRRHDTRLEGAALGATLAIALLLDASALGAWGAVGRPDLTEGVRLPVLSGVSPLRPAPEIHGTVTLSQLVTFDGKRLPLEARAVASWLANRVPWPALPAPGAMEGGDLRCAGATIPQRELLLAADRSLSHTAIRALVAAAEEASVSTLAWIVRTDTIPVGDTPRVRLAPPTVGVMRLTLSPMRRACPPRFAQARIVPLPENELETLLRMLPAPQWPNGRGPELFTARSPLDPPTSAEPPPARPSPRAP